MKQEHKTDPVQACEHGKANDLVNIEIYMQVRFSAHVSRASITALNPLEFAQCCSKCLIDQNRMRWSVPEIAIAEMSNNSVYRIFFNGLRRT